MIRRALGLLFAVFLSACRHEAPTRSPGAVNRYARGFAIESYDGYKLLRILRPYPGGTPQTFVLVPRDSTTLSLPDSLAAYPQIRVPVERIVATSVTHLEPLLMLGEGDKLVGFPQTQYIVSPYYRERVRQGLLTDVGAEMMPDVERILALKPDVMLVFSTGNDRKDFSLYRRNGIPVVYMGEWMEKSPLGRSEWIKVFGALTAKDNVASRLFDTIAAHYTAIRQRAATLPRNRKPVVFKGGKFGDKWYVAGGGSWAAHLIRDAGGRYFLDDTLQTGSMALNHENALIYLLGSQVWLDPGMWASRAQIRREVPALAAGRHLDSLKIYSVNLKTDEEGRILYFEKSPMHPDWVLEDLFRIFGRDSVPADSLHFYAPVP